MGETITLKAEDGIEISAYQALPEGVVRGGIVLMQEAFGLNDHIRRTCDAFANAGYAVIAPAFFDRIEIGIELDDTKEGVARGKALCLELGWELPELDILSAAEQLVVYGKMAAIGYGWGGSLAFLAGCRIEIDAAICYYGGQIPELMEAVDPVDVPMLMHFGIQDPNIPRTDVEAIQAGFPSSTVHLYKAGHGFNSEGREDYNSDAAEQALDRTMDFLAEHVG